VTQGSSSVEGSSPTTKGKAWYVNPWVWAGIGGIVFVTLGRDCTRRIPNPPPVLGNAPSFALSELNGTAITDQTLAGNPYLVQIVGTDCGEDCEQTMAGMVKLHQGFEEGVLGKVPVKQLTFVMGGDESAKHYSVLADEHKVDRNRWYFVRGPDSIIAEVAKAYATMGDKTVDKPWMMGLALVDGAGRCRGLYGTDMMEINRAFFQAEQVSRESK